MNVLRFRVAVPAVFVLCLATVIGSPAQTFTTLVNFDGSNGANPFYGSLIQGLDGNFYGTTYYGGANNQGIVFRITPGGTLTTLYSFCSQSNCTDGANPSTGLVQATNGSLYGTTYLGGTNSNCAGACGTVFVITTEGALTTLHNFDGSDGGNPIAGLVQAVDGNFYGTAYDFGANGYGTVFKITSTGALTTLHSFDLADGAWPFAGLVQGMDGNLYGTTEIGGTSQRCSEGCGTVFKIAPGGVFTSLYSFCSQLGCTDGYYPGAALAQVSDGSLYGTTEAGGAGTIGTVFKITQTGTLTTLYSFCTQTDCPDGDYPYAALTLATDGTLYGTTSEGGLSNHGTVFRITTGGALTTLHRFDGTDGSGTEAGLLESTNGNFYGITSFGGTSSNCTLGCGTVFSLSTGLGPFVQTMPSLGKVGSAVIILGNALTGTTSVTFNGTATSFTVASSTEIKTTVPTGATSGKVQVTTPHGTLTSNVVFRVK